jgi:hypothetical protein
MTLLVAGLVTLLLTAVLTIAGVGAAFILIPVYVALGVDLHVAMATALLLNAVGLGVASVRNARLKLIDYRAGLPILVAASIVSPLGAWVSLGLPRGLLVGLFVGFLVFAALMVLFYRPRARPAQSSRAAALGLGAGVGGLAGFLGGLLGVGGGNVINPALVSLGFEPRRASATTSFAVIFPSLAGFAGHASLSGIAPPLVAVTAVASGVGALAGSYLMTEKLRGAQVKTVLGVVLLAVAAKMAWGLR